MSISQNITQGGDCHEEPLRKDKDIPIRRTANRNRFDVVEYVENGPPQSSITRVLHDQRFEKIIVPPALDSNVTIRQWGPRQSTVFVLMPPQLENPLLS